MFENTTELAENKLLILFILKTIDSHISNSQLTDIILENSLINYFTLQQSINELECSKFIGYTNSNDKKLLYITEKGENTLSFFENRISSSKKSILLKYIQDRLDLIQKELTIQSDFIPEKNNNFSVNLKAFETDDVLIDLKISVPTKKIASDLCESWKKNYSSLYNEIINILTNKK